MNTSLETAGVIQSTICRLFSFPVEMETETPCWRKKRRKQVPKLRAAWIISPFFRIDLCQCPTSPFRVEYLLLKKDELGFTACMNSTRPATKLSLLTGDVYVIRVTFPPCSTKTAL